MKTWTPLQAKHCNAANIHAIDQSREKIAVFDDEEPNHFSLYLYDGENFWPARTISILDKKRAWEILSAWNQSRPLVDFRNDQSETLPGAANPGPDPQMAKSDLAAFLQANTALLRRAYAASGCPQPWTREQYATHRQEFLEFLNQLEKISA